MSAVTIGTAGLVFGAGSGLILSASETSAIEKTVVKDYLGNFAGVCYAGEYKTCEYKILTTLDGISSSGAGSGGGFPLTALTGPTGYYCESVTQERTNDGWAVLTFRSSAYALN